MAEPTRVTLATATPGGGFPFFGNNAAAVINETDKSLNVVTQNTKGSTENIGLLNEGSIASDPSKPEWTVRPDQGIEGVMWVAEPSGMRRGSEKDKLRFSFAPDGSLQREVLEHVSTLE